MRYYSSYFHAMVDDRQCKPHNLGVIMKFLNEMRNIKKLTINNTFSNSPLNQEIYQYKLQSGILLQCSP